MKKIILLLFIIISIFKTSESKAQVNVQDSLALVDLYNSTDGANWAHPWNLASPVDTWNGVIVENNDVVWVILSNDNLTGSIPPSLGNLTGLIQLYLDHNHLSGNIPSSLGNLTGLQTFALGYNNLSGSPFFYLGQSFKSYCILDPK